MKGIPCDKAQFEVLEKAAHKVLCEDIDDYEKNTVTWAKADRVPVHQTTGQLLFPVCKGKRGAAIEKILSSQLKQEVIEVFHGDKDWFPPDEEL